MNTVASEVPYASNASIHTAFSEEPYTSHSGGSIASLHNLSNSNSNSNSNLGPGSVASAAKHIANGELCFLTVFAKLHRFTACYPHRGGVRACMRRSKQRRLGMAWLGMALAATHVTWRVMVGHGNNGNNGDRSTMARTTIDESAYGVVDASLNHTAAAIDHGSAPF